MTRKYLSNKCGKFHSFLNKEFELGFPSPVIERDFIPLPPNQLTVWDAQHPAPPAADPEFECLHSIISPAAFGKRFDSFDAHVQHAT